MGAPTVKPTQQSPCLGLGGGMGPFAPKGFASPCPRSPEDGDMVASTKRGVRDYLFHAGSRCQYWLTFLRTESGTMIAQRLQLKPLVLPSA